MTVTAFSPALGDSGHDRPHADQRQRLSRHPHPASRLAQPCRARSQSALRTPGKCACSPQPARSACVVVRSQLTWVRPKFCVRPSSPWWTRPSCCAAFPPCCRRSACCTNAKISCPTNATASRRIRQVPLAVALPENEQQVREVLRICSQARVPVVARGAGTGLSGGAMPHGTRRNARAVQAQEHPRDRSRRAHRARSARRAQSGDLRGGRCPRPVLRARPLEPDRVQHRRQRGGELGRRALPQVRADGPQPAEAARRDHRRRSCWRSGPKGSTRRATICWRSSPARKDCSAW